MDFYKILFETKLRDCVMKCFSILLLLTLVVNAYGEEKIRTLSDVKKAVEGPSSTKWFEKINLKGYAQFRYNRLGETNKDLKCSACDKSIGDKQGFFLRRARLVFYGDISDRVYVYIQPDYASDAGSSQNYFQIRDAYFDYSLTADKEWRIRTGISKVPFGFENLQSSSNRAPLDRDDAINTAAPNERDTGMYLMYSPSEIAKRFKELSKNNLKGSGDYGMFAIGAYNGQTLNKAEQNNDLHRLVRFTYPFKLASGQFIEASIQAYEGKYFVSGNASNANANFYDQRTAASLIVYPQPFGFQVEYNEGQGPEFDAATNLVKNQKLKGGYAMVNYQLYMGEQRFFPFVRYQEYQGGRKLDDNARSYRVNEWEIGTEWQFIPELELTAAYGISDRLTQSSASDKSHEKGNLIRLQAQFNY
jgi:hypothetical protein